MHVIIWNDMFTAKWSVEADRKQTVVSTVLVFCSDYFWGVFVFNGSGQKQTGSREQCDQQHRSPSAIRAATVAMQHSLQPPGCHDTRESVRHYGHHVKVECRDFWVHSALIWHYINKTCVETTFKGHHLSCMIYLCCAVIQTPTWRLSGCCAVISL